MAHIWDLHLQFSNDMTRCLGNQFSFRLIAIFHNALLIFDVPKIIWNHCPNNPIYWKQLEEIFVLLFDALLSCPSPPCFPPPLFLALFHRFFLSPPPFFRRLLIYPWICSANISGMTDFSVFIYFQQLHLIVSAEHIIYQKQPPTPLFNFQI